MVAQQRTRSAAPVTDGAPISVKELSQFIQTAEKTSTPSASSSTTDAVVLLNSLQNATKLSEQQKLLQQQCKAVVVKSLNTGIIDVNLLSYVKILMVLYLHPNYQALRSNLEWLVEALSSHKIDSSPFHPVLLDVMLRIYRTASDGGVLSTSPVEITIEWAKSMSYAAELDKECRFITLEGDAGGLDTSPLCYFLRYIEEIMAMCVKQVCQGDQSFSHTTTQPTTTTAAAVTTTSSSAEVSRYIECCGECMRATTTVLKTRRNVVLEDLKYSTNTSSTTASTATTLDTSKITLLSTWTVVTNRILNHSLAVLRSDIVHKVSHSHITFTEPLLILSLTFIPHNLFMTSAQPLSMRYDKTRTSSPPLP